MTGRKETLEAVDNTVRIYACGPTVYNFFHIGNGRAFTVYDVLRRYLQYKGYNVQFVQNFTDVDDKIINKANEEGTDFTSVSQKYMNEYFTDADGLNIQRATVHPLATENIQQIIDIVATLVEKGHAYVLDNDVYFRVRSFKDYGQLLGQSIDDLSSGARISVDDRKEDALDLLSGKAQRKANRIGNLLGAKADPAGISNAPLWLNAISAILSTFIAAAVTFVSRIIQTRSHSPNAQTAASSLRCGSM